MSILTLDTDIGRNAKVSKIVSWTVRLSKQGLPCYTNTLVSHRSCEGYILVLLS